MSEEKLYPCSDCGVMRTKAQGGETFAVCEDCWDKHWKKGKYAEPDPEINKYIEVMEENAVKKLFPKGSLIDEVEYADELSVDYSKGDDYITLHGDFTVQQLDTLSAHMKKYTKE